jgi:alpha-mannosidase
VTKIREILVVPHAHHDVGYTDSPRLILGLHTEAVRAAIRLAAQGDATDPAAFRWTFEVARPVDAFLREATTAEIDSLRAAIAHGRLSIGGGYLNNAVLAGDEELVRAYAPVDRFRKLGLPVHIEQHSDVNGLPWGTVPAMARAGLDVVVMALNPDHGRPPFEQPTAFWWEGPDGSKVLAWLSIHYGLAEMWGLLDDEIDRFDASLRPTLERVEARDDYPFDFLVLHATDDNGWPTMAAADGVRAWNERFGDIPMSTSTMDSAMRRALAQARTASLSTWRGEWADWWAHGHGSTAYEVGISRAARSRVRAAEAAMAVARLAGAHREDTERRTAWRRDPVRLRTDQGGGAAATSVWNELLLFNEHTWGADESVREPDSVFTRSHWNAKAAMAFSAFDVARDLLGEGLWRLEALLPTADEGAGLLVFNPLPYARTGTVAVDGPSGEAVAAARDVPGFGLVRVPAPDDAPPTAEPGNILETARYRIEVDPARGGIVGLLDRESGWDLVDWAARTPLGAVIVERVDRAVDHPVLHAGRQAFHPDQPGPAFLRDVATGTATPRLERGAGWQAIAWSAPLPGGGSAQGRLTVHDGIDRMRLDITLDKPANREVEGVYVAFPFDLAEPAFLLETGGAVFEAEREQLPDTCRDWYSVQHAVGITAGSRGVLWSTAEAPLVQLGSIHTGEWARHLDARRGHLFAWLMNNLYFTNFRAEQGGLATFTFWIEPRAVGLDHDAVRRAGEQVAVPLVGRSSLQAGVGSARLLELDGPGIAVSSLSLDPDRPRAVRLRIEAAASGADRVELYWRGPGELVGWRSDVFGNRQSALEGDGRRFALSLGPGEAAMIILAPVGSAAGAGATSEGGGR